MALGAKPDRALLQSLNILNGYLEAEGRSIKVLEAGDCVYVWTAVEAFSEGFKVGLEA